MDLKKFFQQNKAILLSILYILFPLDIIPEAILGPLGLVDDGIVLLFLGALIILKIIRPEWNDKIDAVANKAGVKTTKP